MSEIGGKSKENEYVLKDVPRSILSDECHSLGTLPRLTQPTVGKYLVRVDNQNDYSNYNIEVHPSILELWLYRNRHLWVPKPGEDDYFIHDLHRNYSTVPIENNPNKMFHPLLLPRPYSCELSTIIRQRVYSPEAQKIYEEENYCQDSSESICGKTHIKTYGLSPPFWWKEPTKQKDDVNEEKYKRYEGGKVFEKGWIQIPNFIKISNMTCCERKKALHVLGLPMKHEGCTFYNKHFPAKELTYVRKSFSKKI